MNIFVLLACALVNLTVVQVALGAQGSYPRAATVLGILRYTFWDDHSGAYLNICLLGEGASFQSLLELDDTLDVQGKRLRVFIVEDNQVESCQAIITGGHSISRLPLSLCSSCLVICDQCKQHHRSASVFLNDEQSSVRFWVDLANAKRHGVRFSAVLLALAAGVEGLHE